MPGDDERVERLKFINTILRNIAMPSELLDN